MCFASGMLRAMNSRASSLNSEQEYAVNGTPTTLAAISSLDKPEHADSIRTGRANDGINSPQWFATMFRKLCDHHDEASNPPGRGSFGLEV
jgi:hypothetical protein